MRADGAICASGERAGVAGEQASVHRVGRLSHGERGSSTARLGTSTITGS